VLFSASLTESKKQSQSLRERTDAVQSQLSDRQIHCAELEAQLNHAHNVSHSLLCLCFLSALLCPAPNRRGHKAMMLSVVWRRSVCRVQRA